MLKRIEAGGKKINNDPFYLCKQMEFTLVQQINNRYRNSSLDLCFLFCGIESNVWSTKQESEIIRAFSPNKSYDSPPNINKPLSSA